MSIKALIFDVDGTIADTGETHRQAFNAAFLKHELPWDWSRREYAQLLRTSGGKDRLTTASTTISANIAALIGAQFGADATSAGGPYLTLERLRQLHAAALRPAAA